ncbi:MAG: hypothetical protein IJL81_02555, partial [Clostridia bacterium]|nr:hypothetical protein [Clostridia bacterium]
KEERRRLDKEFTVLADWLLYSLLDYNYLCESLLPKQNVEIRGAEIKVGCAEYKSVLVPQMLTIRSSTLDVLEKFLDCGGMVIFAGDAPQLVDGKISDRAAMLRKKSIAVGFNRNEIVDALCSFRDVEITKSDGAPSDNLFYQLRNDYGAKWLFVTHVNDLGTLKEEYTIQITGEYYAEIYDAMTGEAYTIPVTHKSGKTVYAGFAAARTACLCGSGTLKANYRSLLIKANRGWLRY